jgi:hypothetical protein
LKSISPAAIIARLGMSLHYRSKDLTQPFFAGENVRNRPRAAKVPRAASSRIPWRKQLQRQPRTNTSQNFRGKILMQRTSGV